jgi:glucosamine 6-phosphate synthetase-like amidotransferase/phosphosugar isomerase protein
MTPLMAIAGQALAWTLAVRRGVDPDAPPQLTDVVVLPEA